MGAFIVGALSIAAGVIAGSVAARRAVRGEVEQLRSMLRERNGHEPAPASVPVPVVAAPPPPAEPPAETKSAAAAPESEEIAPEVLMVLTAAVAAFLGKRARIRRATLVQPAGASAWAQQGRVYVQASHALNVHHR